MDQHVNPIRWFAKQWNAFEVRRAGFELPEKQSGCFGFGRQQCASITNRPSRNILDAFNCQDHYGVHVKNRAMFKAS